MSREYKLNTSLVGATLREEQASTVNPTIVWLDFVFTDDKPNENGVGVRSSQFASLQKSGVLMPLKVAEGKIAPGHENALPVGVISSLEQRRDENTQTTQVLGKAALWAEERPEDVAQIKAAFASGDKLQISWELLYGDEELDTNGVRWLVDPVVRAATIVGMPAYAGRTPVLAVASVETEEVSEFLSEAAVWTTAFINNLPDSCFLYIEPGGTKDSEGKTTPRSLRHFPVKDASGKVDMPHLRNALSRIPQSNVPADVKARCTKKAQDMMPNMGGGSSSLENDKVELEELNTKLTEALAKIGELETAAQTANTELESLRAFKAAVEQKEQQAALLQTRIGQFAEAGITFTPEEVTAKQDYWLKLDDEAFKFLVSELKSAKVATASLDKDGKPVIPEVGGGSGDAKLTATSLRDALKPKSK